MRIQSLVLILVFLSSCTNNSKLDDQLLNDIAGVWSASYEDDGFSLYGESLYRKDGTSIRIGKMCIANNCKITTVEEKFEISNGELKSIVVLSDDSDNPIGRVVSDTIKSITTETLTFINTKGEEYIRNKVHTPLYIKKSS